MESLKRVTESILQVVQVPAEPNIIGISIHGFVPQLKRTNSLACTCVIASHWCRPFHGLGLFSADDPSTKVLGYYRSSAPRTAL